MENDLEKRKTRFSRIVLIKQEQMLIFNDHVRIIFKHQKTFKIIWNLCQSLKEKPNFQKLGGLPSDDLTEIIKRKGTRITKIDLATLWYDEILFKRNRQNIYNLFEVKNIKNEVEISSGKLVSDLLQAIFGKVKPPEGSSYHKNTRLYSVLGDFDQIFMFESLEEAKVNGYDKEGISEVTRHRTTRGAVGFLDWHYLLKIDEKGGVFSDVYVKMINLSSRPISTYMLPIWSEKPLEDIKVRLKNGKDLPIKITTNTKGKREILEFVIHFHEPMPPGKIIEFNYSFYTPELYKPGEDFFDWYFDQPQAKYKIDIHTPANLTINWPIVYEDQNEEIIQAKKISKRHLQWTKYFPKIGSKYTINFVLEKDKNK